MIAKDIILACCKYLQHWINLLYHFRTCIPWNLNAIMIWYLPSFTSGSDSKASAYNVGDLGLIPGLERSPGEENGNPLQFSCLENPMDGGAW